MSSRKSSSNAAQQAQSVDDIRRSKNFISFFAKAFDKFDEFDSDKDWARQATLAFRRKYGYSATFPTVYFAFLNEAEKQNESESVGDEENSVDSNDSYERDGFVTDKIEYEEGHDDKSEDEWDDNESASITSSEHEAEEDEEEVKPRRTRVVQAPVTSPRRSQRIQSRSNSNAALVETNDDSEFKQGQRMLNKMIYSEYNKWFSAFQDEAEEDGSENAMTAEERFEWHCAKILSRKTDIPADVIIPVIGAWIHEHHNA